MTAAVAQTIHFHGKHYESVFNGEKVTTVRWREDVQLGAAIFVFDLDPTASLRGQVTAVTSYSLANLSAEEAHQPPGSDMTLFAEQLRENYYPLMTNDAVVQVVEIGIDIPTTPTR